MKPTLFVLLSVLIFIPCILCSQPEKLEDYYKRLAQAQILDDSLHYFIRIAEGLMNTDPQKGFDLLTDIQYLIPGDDSLHHCEFMVTKALLYRNLGKFDQALSLVDSTIQLSFIDHYPQEKVRSLKLAAELHSRLENFELADSFYQICLQKYEKNADLEGQGYVYRGLSSLNRKQGNFTQGMEYGLLALDLFKKSGNEEGVASVYNSLGLLYTNIGEMDKAKEAFEKTAEIHQRLSNKTGLANAYTNLGVMEANDNKLKQAKEYFLKVETLTKELNNLRKLAGITYNIGVTYKDLSVNDSAQIYYEKSQEIYQKLGVTTHPRLVMSLGEIYALTGEPEKANRYLRQGYETAKKSNEVGLTTDLLELLAKSYAGLGLFEEAYQIYLERNELSDSLLTEDKNKQLAEMETAYQVKEKDAQIVFLEEKQAQQRTIIFLATALIILLLAFVMMLIRNMRIRRQINNRLMVQKEEIEEKNAQNELLLKEIHHRVKNNLQVISSLLSLQSMSVEDESAIEALVEGQSRVQSMALIHQDLYSSDNFTGIQIEKYIRKLCESLFNTYNIVGDRIQLNLDISPLTLDVSTLIPLGLILNELISNALKYAFPDQRKGLIGISIKPQDDKLLLKVWDDGIGIPSELHNRGFGHRLIKTFAKKLKADVEINRDPGTMITMSINNYKVA